VTTLAEEGFLADEASGALVAHIAGKYAPWLKELRLLNRSLVALQYELSVHPESARELASAALFVRGLSHVQAGVLLLERGMLAPGKAMLRCALEALFALAACSRDQKTALAYFDSDEVNRKKWVERLAQVKDDSTRGSVDADTVQQILADASARIQEVGAREIKVREFAKLADLEDVYLTTYPYLSGAVHSSARELDQHVEVNADGKVVALLTNPVLEGLELPLLIAGEIMVSMARAINAPFPTSRLADCEARFEALKALKDHRAG